MAKIKLELELDFINEEGEEMTLEDNVKSEILHNVETRIISTIREKLTKDAEKRLTDKIDQLTTDAVVERMNTFMTTPKNITDKYGDVIKENVTVDSLLKEKIESAFDKRTLDQDGNKQGYNPKFTLFDFIAQKNIESLVNEKISTIIKDVKDQISTTIKDRVRTTVADNLTDFILENGKHPLIDKKK